MREEYKGKIFKLSGGFLDNWEDYRISYSEYGGERNGSVEYWCSVVGFKGGPGRSWGHRTFKQYKHEPVVKNKYITKVVEKIRYKERLRKPRNIFDRVLSRFGYYKRI